MDTAISTGTDWKLVNFSTVIKLFIVNVYFTGVDRWTHVAPYELPEGSCWFVRKTQAGKLWWFTAADACRTVERPGGAGFNVLCSYFTSEWCIFGFVLLGGCELLWVYTGLIILLISFWLMLSAAFATNGVKEKSREKKWYWEKERDRERERDPQNQHMERKACGKKVRTAIRSRE